MNVFRRLLRVLPAAAFLLGLALPGHAAGWPGNNDSMFPPAPSAKADIDLDGRGFLIHGKRVFIVAGELQYARTPRALWRDRLLRIKRAGYNTVQTYAFWNFHEPREGQFDFSSDNHDLDAFLKLIQSLGMYAIVRTGPYVNAEWDTGGLPIWLRFKPGLRPLTDNAPFYAAVTPYWDRLFPIVVRNQITRGGPVILVQLDNEHTFDSLGRGVGGGTDLPDAFYRHYRQVALKAGVVVPYFFSGLNHSDDPAGDGPLDTSDRTTPWFSTEFWTGWYGWYGVDAEKRRKLVRATWKVLAYGGAGYTHYTMAGGSDFETWNNNEQAASYDFGSPIGQAGDFRSDYYPLKRAALFAAAFPQVLSDSVASAGGGGTAGVTNSAVSLTSRQGKAGRILFLDNPGDQPQPVQVKTADGMRMPSAGPIQMEEGEILPIVMGYPLLPDVSLTLGAARILGTATQGRTTTLVIYGKPGEPGELHFRVPELGVTLGQHAGDSLTAGHGRVILKTVFSAGDPRVFTFQVGTRTVRVISERASLADRTWLVPVGENTEIVCGPDYVGEADRQAGRLALQTEQMGLSGMPPGPCWVWTADKQIALTKALVPDRAASGTAPALGAWSADATVPQAQPGFSDGDWLHSEQPRPMGADGDNGAYAWYRATVTAPTAGTYQLDVSDYADWLTVFVDGKRAGSGDVNRTTTDAMTPRPADYRVSVPLKAGPHTLALLAAHYGRNKLVCYYGPLDTIDSKGVTGEVSLTPEVVPSQGLPVFRWKADENGPNDADTLAAPALGTAGADWQDAHAYDDVFHGRLGYAWFRATLPNVPGPHRRLTFASIDDLGTVTLNGTQIASGIGVNANATVSVDAAWRPGGPNVLAVLVQNTSGGGGLGKVTLSGGITDGGVVRGWRMRGGETPPGPTAATWKPLAAGAVTGVPCWFRTEFTATPPAPDGPHPILRVQTSTLTRGFVWLNGHSLGRYPEVSRDASGQGQLVDGVYLPECWLRPGRNELVVFDEEGVTPSKVRITVEQAASRRDVSLTAQTPLP